MRRPLLALVAVLLLAGCGGGDDEAKTDTTTTTTTSAPVVTTDVRVYFLLDEKVWPVAREVEGSDVESATLEALFEGPTAEEKAQLGFRSAIPGGGPSVTIEDGVAHVQPFGRYPRAALAQITYTLTQFPEVESVEITAKSYTRGDFEALTPAILVESPLYFQDVGNPVRATGTANTFEATFQYQLTDTDGRIVDENFVTATSGTGTRGTFDFTTKKYDIPFDGVGALIVYELSAKDGSRINLREIPVRMSE